MTILRAYWTGTLRCAWVTRVVETTTARKNITSTRIVSGWICAPPAVAGEDKRINCSMAAGAYAEAIGGTPAQVENAAEMAMEHHLGLTCDPVGGLVQIPCIERNGIAAEKALKLGALALLEDGHDKKVSLDMVIQTMLQTGRDMKATYKETSLAGLAITLQQEAVPVSVRVVEC